MRFATLVAGFFKGREGWKEGRTGTQRLAEVLGELVARKLLGSLDKYRDLVDARLEEVSISESRNLSQCYHPI